MNTSEQIEKLSPNKGDLLVVSYPCPLTVEQRKRVIDGLTPLADRLEVQLLALEGGATAQLQPGLHALLEEHKKQTAILERMADQQSLLIRALAEDQGEQDPDARPLTYMDGTPCL